MSTAIWMVTWSEPESRTPLKGCEGPNSVRQAMRPSISTSTSSSSRWPKSAWERSLTLYSRPDEVFSTESTMEKAHITRPAIYLSIAPSPPASTYLCPHFGFPIPLRTPAAADLPGRSPDHAQQYHEEEQGSGSLLVRNIPLSARAEDLRVPFERFGPVRDVYLPKDYYSGEPRGFAFVEFVDPYDASEAQYHMNRQVFFGREITVVLAAESRKRPEDMRTRTRVSGYSRGHEGRRSSHYGRSRSRSRSASPRPRGGGRARSRSYSPAPRRRDDYSASPRGRESHRSKSPVRHPKEHEEDKRRSYSPPGRDGGQRDADNGYEKRSPLAYSDGSPSLQRVARPSSGSPPGSRSRSPTLLPPAATKKVSRGSFGGSGGPAGPRNDFSRPAVLACVSRDGGPCFLLVVAARRGGACGIKRRRDASIQTQQQQQRETTTHHLRRQASAATPLPRHLISHQGWEAPAPVTPHGKKKRMGNETTEPAQPSPASARSIEIRDAATVPVRAAQYTACYRRALCHCPLPPLPHAHPLDKLSQDRGRDGTSLNLIYFLLCENKGREGAEVVVDLSQFDGWGRILVPLLLASLSLSGGRSPPYGHGPCMGCGGYS
ncbi:hypothetical protein ZWY2020_028369 [Hordeum vulgare]|nr:hypothetical protein ZWY2020_028369 [Hordeum vulgare]